ncbi:rRNA-processing protein FCF1, putative [Babesia caballi]|uniref:rRNA-processing protein FCF1, putative n=1 Tax=Babesia caballi TaxID=5871 RepID=A0AAV4LYU7_BABCB|nr:rRNA-processing protein FCF1, putative [Babesia caballi]
MGWFGSSDTASSAPSSGEGVGLMARAEAFQKDVDAVLADVTRMSLPLQKAAFECCVRCFDGGNDNLDRIGDCVKQCQSPPEKFGNAVQTELNQLQDSLMNCQQGKAKKTRKFAEVKRRMSPKDSRIATVKAISKVSKPEPLVEAPKVHSGMFFNYNENLVPPYQVIVDTNFVNASIQNKLDLHKGMLDCLIAKCIVCVTDCVVAELEKLGHRYRLALQLVKDPRVERLTCAHTGTYADDCIVERITTRPAARGRFKSLRGLGLVASRLVLNVGSPEGQVVPEQLHDQRAVLVAVFAHAVELGDGLVERALGHLAGLVRHVENLVEKHREVERQAQPDGVSGLELGLCDLRGLLVGDLGRVGGALLVLVARELAKVAVVVTLHLVVEDEALAVLRQLAHVFTLTHRGGGDEAVVEEREDVGADVRQFFLNFRAVCSSKVLLNDVGLVRLLLLDAADDAPGCAPRRDGVLVGDRLRADETRHTPFPFKHTSKLRSSTLNSSLSLMQVSTRDFMASAISAASQPEAQTRTYHRNAPPARRALRCKSA